MALLSGTDGAELLDLLFDQSNGILTNDSYMTSGFIDNPHFAEPVKSPDFGFVSYFFTYACFMCFFSSSFCIAFSGKKLSIVSG
jgi:hypothetical protein